MYVQLKAACQFSVMKMNSACFCREFDSHFPLRELAMVCAHVSDLVPNQVIVEA